VYLFSLQLAKVLGVLSTALRKQWFVSRRKIFLLPKNSSIHDENQKVQVGTLRLKTNRSQLVNILRNPVSVVGGRWSVVGVDKKKLKARKIL
jgi:hypothetical protein